MIAVAVSCLFSLPAAAIEGLTVSVQCPNIVLSWPSVEGETYIVQYCPALSTNPTWSTLTNSLPGQVGTNITMFVVSNMVQCPQGGGSGGSPGGSPPVPQDDPAMLESSGTAAESLAAATPSSWPLAVPVDGSQVPVPAILYPPGFDFSGYRIYEPATGQWVDGAGYVAAPLASGPQPLDSPSGSGGDPGFYQVVRVGPHFFGLTNGTVLSGVVSLPMEFGNTNLSASLDVLFLDSTNECGPVPNVVFPPIPGGIAQGITATWDTTQETNGVYTFSVGAYLNDYVYSPYGMTMTAYEDNPVTVVVSNVISFGPYPVGGDAI